MDVNKLVLVETDGSIPKNAVVAKDHTLIEKIAGFNLQELRLIAFCLAHIDSRPGATNEKTIQAKVTDLTHIFPMNEKSAYDVIKNAVSNIGQKPMEFDDGIKIHLWSWFSAITYEKGAGKFEFTFNPAIEPFLLGLKGKLSMYRLYEIPFKSTLAFLLFENLNCWLFKGKWTVELDQLRTLLGVKGKYARWIDFRKRCLDEPLVEINKNSNLKATYKTVLTVRTVTSVTFTLKKKRVNEPQDQYYWFNGPSRCCWCCRN